MKYVLMLMLLVLCGCEPIEVGKCFQYKGTDADPTFSKVIGISDTETSRSVLYDMVELSHRPTKDIRSKYYKDFTGRYEGVNCSKYDAAVIQYNTAKLSEYKDLIEGNESNTNARIKDLVRRVEELEAVQMRRK